MCMNSKLYITILRVLASLVLFVSAFMLPWWVVFMFGFAALFVFPHFIEFIIVMIILDVLYSPLVGENAMLFGLVYTCIGLVSYVSVMLIKRSIVWYHW